MNNRLVTMRQVVVLMVVLLTTNRVFGGNAEGVNIGMFDTRQLLSVQPMERSQALEGLTAKYREVSTALLKTLEEAKAQFRTDYRHHSPLHSAILAVDAWQVIDADALLLSCLLYTSPSPRDS